jgi:hypothetical protein
MIDTLMFLFITTIILGGGFALIKLMGALGKKEDPLPGSGPQATPQPEDVMATLRPYRHRGEQRPSNPLVWAIPAMLAFLLPLAFVVSKKGNERVAEVVKVAPNDRVAAAAKITATPIAIWELVRQEDGSTHFTTRERLGKHMVDYIHVSYRQIVNGKAEEKVWTMKLDPYEVKSLDSEGDTLVRWQGQGWGRDSYGIIKKSDLKQD